MSPYANGWQNYQQQKIMTWSFFHNNLQNFATNWWIISFIYLLIARLINVLNVLPTQPIILKKGLKWKAAETANELSFTTMQISWEIVSILFNQAVGPGNIVFSLLIYEWEFQGLLQVMVRSHEFINFENDSFTWRKSHFRCLPNLQHFRAWIISRTG